MDKKIKNIIIIVLFFGSLVTLSIITILGKNEYSSLEKRYLTTLAQVWGSSFTEGELQANTENWLSDQFPQRSGILMAESSLRLVTEKEIQNIYIGEDGYLFSKYTDADVGEKYEDNISAIISFLENEAADRYISVNAMLVPTKSLILSEKLPVGAVIYNQAELLDRNSSKLIDLRKLYEDKKNDYQLYYRSDHHWTMYGAGLAAEEYLNAIGIEENIDLEKAYMVSDNFRGTEYAATCYDGCEYDSIYRLAEDSSFTAGEKYSSLYVETKLDTDDEYAYYLGGNYGELIAEGRAENGRRLLIIKDSYANCFLPFMCDYFESIYMLDLRYYTKNLKGYLKNNGITDILILYNMDNLLTTDGLAGIDRLYEDSGENEEKPEKKESEAGKLMEEILQALEPLGITELKQIESYGEDDYTERFSGLYGDEISKVTDGCIAYAELGDSATEISILKPADSVHDVRMMLKSRQTTRAGNFRGYNPAEEAKVKNAIIRNAGEYVVLIILDDPQSAESIITGILKGEKR